MDLEQTQILSLHLQILSDLDEENPFPHFVRFYSCPSEVSLLSMLTKSHIHFGVHFMCDIVPVAFPSSPSWKQSLFLKQIIIFFYGGSHLSTCLQIHNIYSVCNT